LVDKIVSVTNVAAMIANPFDGMQIADGVREKKLRREAPSYLTSCGLAMRRFLQ
jgi:type IV pilus assembly protein PilM